MATLAATDLRPRRLVIEHLSLTIEGRTLEDVALGGWAYGPELGTAPVVVIVGGITASPFPFGDGQAKREGAQRAVVAGALRARPDRSRASTRCSARAGRATDRRGAASTTPARCRRSRCSAWPTWWRRGSTAAAARSPVTFVGASLGGMVGVAFAVRHPERCAQARSRSRRACGPTAGARRRATCSASWCATALRNGDVATGMSRARQLGMLTYRGRDELDTRFGKLAPGPRAAAGGRVPRSPRPPLRRALSGEDVPAAERGDRSRLDRRRRAEPCAPRSSASPPRRSSSACPATCCSRGRCRWSCIASCRRPARSRRCGSSTRSTATTRSSPIRIGSPSCCAAPAPSAASCASAARPRFEGVGVEPVREIRIGMVGCGTVGRGLLEMIERQQRRGGRSLRRAVPRVADRGARPDARIAGRCAAGIPLTDRPLELVSDPEVDVVVEVAGGTAMEPMLTAALAAGKPVVTANKALLASKLAELGVLAAAHRDAALLRSRGRRGAADHPPPQSSRRRDRQPLAASSTAPATS